MAALATNLAAPHHFVRQPLESTDGSMDSNDLPNNFSVGDDNDNASCCSDDTVLSVGNENPVPAAAAAAPAVPDNNLSFKNIESHLNAISKITNSTLAESQQIAACSSSSSSSGPTSPLSASQRLSPSSTKSPQTPTGFLYRDFHQHHHHHQQSGNPLFRPALSTSPKMQCASGPSSPESPLNRSPKPDASVANLYFRQTAMLKAAATSNNDTANNQASLKFSIDNILKADFGRRITDPINIKKSKTKKSER